MRFKLGELFCGPGGIALGAGRASIKAGRSSFSISPCWANDYDPDTCETYRNNICPNNRASVVCRNVRDLCIEKLEPIDAFAFGFPCNDFSIVGEQRGINGTFGPLYTHGVRVLNHFKPYWFLAENVGGLRTANGGQVFGKIINELADAGYAVTPHLYKLEEYGIPQSRHRIIIVGFRRDTGLRFRVPAPSGVSTTCREAIENPPIAKDAPNNELTQQSPAVIARLKHIRPGQNVFTANLPERYRLKIQGARISQIYKRLDPAKPAYTVTGSGGGGTHVYHWSENRALTNRERARLQTFPDDFVFSGSKESVRKQIGMAVPPRASQIICEAILKTFAGVGYAFVPANINVAGGC